MEETLNNGDIEEVAKQSTRRIIHLVIGNDKMEPFQLLSPVHPSKGTPGLLDTKCCGCSFPVQSAQPQ